MAEFSWRGKARFVAFFDLVTAALWIVGLIIAIVFGTSYTAAIKEREKQTFLGIQDETDTSIKIYMYTFWPVLMISAVHISLVIWLSISLIKATETPMDATVALQLSQKWRNFNVIFIIVTGIFQILLAISFIDIIFPALIGILIGFCIRGLFMYFVCSYIKELEAIKISNDIIYPLHSTA